VSTPFGTTVGGNNNNFTNTPNDFGNVAGFNAFSGFNPAFNGGVNPVFGNSSGQNTNFAFNANNGFNPLLGNPAGIVNMTGSPFGTNALLNNPMNPNGLGAANTFGSNPLIFNPLSVANGGNASLGSNPLAASPINAVAPGQINNAVTNPGLFNPASNASFSNNPSVIATGQPFGGNGLPINGLGVNGVNNLNPLFSNAGALNSANAGFGSSYATYGGALLASGYPTYFASPAYGLGGYPFMGGYYPGYYGYGGYFPGGATPYDALLSRYQRGALLSSRYNLNNARASAAYSAANFYNDLAAATAMSSYKTSTGIKPYYNINTGSHHMAGAIRRHDAAAARAQMIPREQLVDDQGQVKWPPTAPNSPSDVGKARSDADAAVATVAGEFHKDGRAAVSDVIAAQDRVRDYASKAMDHLKGQPAEASGLVTFLASLDYALTTMGDGHRATGPTAVRPDNAPKSGGDVLKDTIERDTPKGEPGTRRPDADSPAGPKSGGDVLKDTVKADRKGQGR